MKRFMLLYTGPAPKPAEMSADQLTERVNSWAQWGQSIGAALVDAGLPFVEGVDLVESGEQADPLWISGYAIVQAEDMSQALSITKNHPFMVNGAVGRGKHTTMVFELMTEPPATYAAQNQPLPVTPAETPQSISSTPPRGTGATLPPPAEEEAVPPAAPGELTIPHEPAQNEQPPLPPPPSQPPIQ